MRLDSLGNILFCHATPRSDTEIFTERTGEGVLRPIIDAAADYHRTLPEIERLTGEPVSVEVR